MEKRRDYCMPDPDQYLIITLMLYTLPDMRSMIHTHRALVRIIQCSIIYNLVCVCAHVCFSACRCMCDS